VVKIAFCLPVCQESVILKISNQVLIKKGKYGEKLSSPKYNGYPGLSLPEGFFRMAPDSISYEHITEN